MRGWDESLDSESWGTKRENMEDRERERVRDEERGEGVIGEKGPDIERVRW